MDRVEGLDGLRQTPPGGVLAVGNFDGMHLGHRAIIDEAIRLGRQHGSKVTLVTFEPHPLSVLRPDAVPPRLSPATLKQSLIEKAGVDRLVLLAPYPDVLSMTARHFWELVRDEVRPAAWVAGDSFTFGKGAAGTIEQLVDWSRGSGVAVHVVPPRQVVLMDMQIVAVSSTLARFLISEGRLRDAAIVLGRAYALVGRVVHGRHRGRTIGFPTINLDCADQMIPSDGVYAGRCRVGDAAYPAAVNIGPAPTFGESARTVEAHLIGFSGDLYGQTLQLELLDFIRDQRTFAGTEALRIQLNRDVAMADGLKNFDPARPLAHI
jgi:riboflavin kinase/FMN adenylyltransferase